MTWEQKRETVIATLPKDDALRNKARIVLTTLYHRITEMEEYEFKGKIESKVHLFKSSNTLSNEVNETFGLSDVSIRLLIVHN